MSPTGWMKNNEMKRNVMVILQVINGIAMKRERGEVKCRRESSQYCSVGCFLKFDFEWFFRGISVDMFCFSLTLTSTLSLILLEMRTESQRTYRQAKSLSQSDLIYSMILVCGSVKTWPYTTCCEIYIGMFLLLPHELNRIFLVRSTCLGVKVQFYLASLNCFLNFCCCWFACGCCLHTSTMAIVRKVCMFHSLKNFSNCSMKSRFLWFYFYM